MTPYLNELRINWRPLAAALLGMAGGLMTASYVIGIMAPYQIAEFGWSKSDFALVSATGLVGLPIFPIVGRLTDKFGVRKMALVGAVATPVLFLALSQLQDIRTYTILTALQCSVLVTTTPPVFGRAVMEYTERARGLALGIVMAGPAIAVAIGGPLLNNFVDAHGWRAGYLVMVAFSAFTGLSSMLLLPPDRKGTLLKPKRKSTQQDYAKIFRTPAFWIILFAVFLVSMPQSTMMSQLSLVLGEKHVMATDISSIISFFAGGMLIGRFLTGLALDRFSAPVVAAVGLLLSAVGLFIFASALNTQPFLMLAAMLFGLSCGAEGDVMAYLVARNFGVRIYSTVAGMLAATVATAGPVSAITLSVMLRHFSGFTPYLTLMGCSVVIGSLCFLLLKPNPVIEDEEEISIEDARTA